MTRAELLTFLRARRYAVEASVASDHSPQAAIVGVAVTAGFELVFDTLIDTRKARNYLQNPRAAFVFGSLGEDADRTVQYEGLVDRPSGPTLAGLIEAYLAVFPDGRERQAWPGLTYFRVRPAWLRYTDYRTVPPAILELSRDQLFRLP
jgi:hypothetical protein